MRYGKLLCRSGRLAAAAAAATAVLALLAGGGAAAETPVERGAYLVNGIAGCGNCHTPKDASGKPTAGAALSGGFAFDIPPGHAVASNITPDPQDGIGSWSDADVKRAIVEGVRPDGTRLVRTMAFDWYARISPDDLDAIVAYLRSLPPRK